ncbi:hypothetical protein ACQ4PT_026924 [Festuca glaucescens]
MVRPGIVDEASWLETVHLLGEIAVKKGILHVQLVHRPLARRGERENHANGGWLDDGGERLAVVDACVLCEAADDPTGFVPFEGAVGVSLVPEDPFSGDEVGAGRSRNELPCPVADERGELFPHGSKPIRVTHRFTNRSRERRDVRQGGCRGEARVARVRLEHAHLSACHHLADRRGRRRVCTA